MPATAITLFEWKTGLFAPSGLLSGYPGGVIPSHPMLEVFGDPNNPAAVYDVYGTINAAAIATGQVGTLYSWAYPTSTNIRVETGTTVGAGSTFTLLTPESVFSGNSVREVICYPEFGRFRFNTAALIALGITNVTISGNIEAMVATPPRLIAEIVQSVLAGGGGGSTSNQIPPVELPAGENLSRGVVFIENGNAYQVDDPRVLRQSARGWVDESYGVGETATVNLVGQFNKPAAIDSLPVGLDLFASPGGSITYDGDSVDPLRSRDYMMPMGRSYDGLTFHLNALSPVVGRKP